jgi:hypothetical protein
MVHGPRHAASSQFRKKVVFLEDWGECPKMLRAATPKHRFHISILAISLQKSKVMITVGIGKGKNAMIRKILDVRIIETENTPAPKSLITEASPVEGTAADQLKLSTGKTIEGAAKLFAHSCIAKVSSYKNNCAHYLSDAFIRANYDDLSRSHDCVTYRCGSPQCTSGGKRPVRAHDMNCWFLTKDSNPVTAVSRNSGFYSVFQKRKSDGQGHVVILDSNTWKFYGTGWFEAGQPSPNYWEHWYYQW